MKSFFTAAAAASLMAGAASAQMVFEQGDVSLSYYNYPDNPSIGGFVLDASGAYQIGQFGVQLDATTTVLTDFIDLVELYSVAGRAYKTLPNGTKLGGYLKAEFIRGAVDEEIYGYGAEALFALGALDIEAYAGAATITGYDTFGNAGIQAYYEISPSFELSAGGDFLWDLDGDSMQYYNLAAEYSFSGIPVSLLASYTFSGTGNINVIGISASYSFGPNTDSRLFGNRIYPIHVGI